MAMFTGATLAFFTCLPLLGCTDKDSGSPGTDSGGDGGSTADGGSDTGDTGTSGLSFAVELPTEPVDQCRDICGTVTVSGTGASLAGIGFSLESDLDGFLALTPDSETETNTKGVAGFCVQGPLTPGTHQLAVHFDVGDRLYELTTLDVRPFGWAYGLDKPVEALSSPDWVPAFSDAQLQADPVFTWQDGTWIAQSVLAPTTVWFNDTRFMYFAGTEDSSVFYLGIATSDGNEDFELVPDYILSSDQTGTVKGDWDYYAQNTPEAIVYDDQVWLYYNGRSTTTGGLSIGVARSDDGYDFSRVASPVLSPTGVAGDFDESGVAHPSVEVRAVDFADNELEASEVFELWYASGTLEIGYALSTDGLGFERYCGGSVFAGRSGTWDAATTKAPEVIRYDDRYYMTYSGCGQGCYEIGWAVSDDGIRWVQADAPIIPAQPDNEDGTPNWNSYGTQEGFIELDEDGTWRIWYAGTGDNHGSIGSLETRYGE